jgi:ABC-type phosphate transport system auxiliary subunit
MPGWQTSKMKIQKSKLRKIIREAIGQKDDYVDDDNFDQFDYHSAKRIDALEWERARFDVQLDQNRIKALEAENAELRARNKKLEDYVKTLEQELENNRWT